MYKVRLKETEQSERSRKFLENTNQKQSKRATDCSSNDVTRRNAVNIQIIREFDPGSG